MKPLVFIHGWGMNSTIWHDVIRGLKDYECRTIDLGFIRGGETNWHDLHKPAIYIGHSLGCLWALKQPDIKPAAFISVSGFTCFNSFTPQTAIEIMQAGLSQKPVPQMKAFWKRAGYNFTDQTENEEQLTNDAEALNVPALDQGLIWLKEWDAKPELKNLNCPVGVIASKKDRIVPENATADQWRGHEIIWHQTASHTLPQQQPAWLAFQIKTFLQSIA